MALTGFLLEPMQVVFSTSIMYNNYVTIAERRRQAQLAREHAERLQVRVVTAGPMRGVWR